MKKISIKNFRVFRTQQEFELNPITILTGTNNSGKSAIQKFLQLLQNSIEVKDGNVLFNQLSFPEEINSPIGNFDNNITFNSNHNSLSFSFGLDISYLGQVTIELTFVKKGNPFKAVLQNIVLKSDKLSNIEYCNQVELDSIEEMDEQEDWGLSTNNNISDLSLKLHELMLSYKKGILIESYLNEEMTRTSGSPTYSKDILYLVNQLTDKGYELNYCPTFEGVPVGIVWDPKKKKVIEYNLTPSWYFYKFWDQSKETVFSTFLTELVLGSENILGKKNQNENFSALKECCGQYKILTIDDFLKEYRIFELSIIKEKLSYMVSGANRSKDFSFLDFFYDPYKNVKFYTMDKIRGTTVISKILNSKEYKSCFPNATIESKPKFAPTFRDALKQRGIDRKESKKFHPNTAYEEMNNLLMELDNVERFVLEPLILFGKQLYEFSTNLSLLSQQYKFNKYLLFNEPQVKHEPHYKYADIILNGQTNSSNSEVFLNKWLVEFGLGERLNVTPIKAEETIIGYSFSIVQNGALIPIHTNGLGGSKIIALLMKIAVGNKYSTILLEEPESNLHPAYQSKMAEMISEAVELFGIHFIVETHSEYFIRKFQYLVASEKSSLNANKVSIYYLFHPDKVPVGKKQVEKLEIRPDGILKQDFGPGFFDESTRLTMDLLKLQNAN